MIKLLVLALLFLAMVLAASAYLSRQLALWWGLRRKGLFFIVLLVLTLACFSSELFLTYRTSPLASLGYVAAGGMLGFLLYLGMVVTLLHLASFLVPIPRRLRAWLSLLAALIISAYATWNAFDVKVKELSYTLPGAGEELRILQWSDVHLGHLRGASFLNALVEQSNALDAHALVITGDLFDGIIRQRDGSLEVLRELDMPAYFIEGNHDVYSGIQEIRMRMEEAGVRVLRNERVMLGEVQLLGLDYMLADREAFDMNPEVPKSYMDEVLPGLRVDRDAPLVLLHHAPYGIPLAAELGADLYLSGHTHGGQLFPMTWLNELLFRYNRGLHRHERMFIYVSEGAGTAGIPMRLGTHSFMDLHILRPE